MKNENYMEYILKKQQDPLYRDKKVTIEYRVNPRHAVFKITDQGNGFNYKKVIDGFEKKVRDKFLPHGRGISMTMNVFDSIRYNEKGNQVVLEKKFKYQ